MTVIGDYSYGIFLGGVLPYLAFVTAAGAFSDFGAARGETNSSFVVTHMSASPPEQLKAAFDLPFGCIAILAFSHKC